MNKFLDRWRKGGLEPVNGSLIALFRVIFGFTMLMQVSGWFHSGWIKANIFDPTFHFTYIGFGWVAPLPDPLMWFVFVVLALSSVAFIFGYRYRISSALVFFSWTYIFLIDQTYYNNHYYLFAVVAFVLMFLPSGKGAKVPAWTLWSLRLVVGIPYFFGGIAKLNPDWIRGEPMRTLLYSRVQFPVIGQYFHEEWMVFLFSYSGIFLDLFAVPFLLWKKTRLPMYILLGSFHLLNAQLFNIGTFPYFMLFATLVFFPPDWPRKFFSRFGISFGSSESNPTKQRPKWAMYVLGIFFLAQLVLPFRHHLYPNFVLWSQQGLQFSWHMMSTSRVGTVEFSIAHEASQTQWTYDASQILTRRQLQKMNDNPHMVLSFAHHLVRVLESQGINDVEIYVRHGLRLNSRASQFVIRPSVDLAKVKRGLGVAEWIYPLNTPRRIEF